MQVPRRLLGITMVDSVTLSAPPRAMNAVSEMLVETTPGVRFTYSQ